MFHSFPLSSFLTSFQHIFHSFTPTCLTQSHASTACTLLIHSFNPHILQLCFFFFILIHTNSPNTIYCPTLPHLFCLLLIMPNSSLIKLLCSVDTTQLSQTSVAQKSVSPTAPHLNQFTPAFNNLHIDLSPSNQFTYYCPHFTFSLLQYRPQLPVDSFRFSTTVTSLRVLGRNPAV